MSRTPGLRRWAMLVSLAAALGAEAQFVEGEEEEVQEQDGFLRTRVPGSPLCLYWQDRTYTYNLDATGSARTPGNTELTAIEESFRTWSSLAASCTDFRFVKGPTVTRVETGYDANGSANTNVLTFREKDCDDVGVVPEDDTCFADSSCGNKYRCWEHDDTTIALTTTTFSFRTGIIYDADIEFNAAPHPDGSGFLFTTVSSPPCEVGGESVNCVATDLQNTLTHEIGHVVGLDHVTIPGATMEASAPVGETQKRIIDFGTSQGFCGTYPTGRDSPPCDATGTLSRRIVAVNQGTSCHAAWTGGPAGLVAWALAGLLRRRRGKPSRTR